MQPKCPLCYKPHETREDARKCFMEHTREEHLLWASRELYRLCGEGYDLLDLVSSIMAKYDLDDEWVKE